MGVVCNSTLTTRNNTTPRAPSIFLKNFILLPNLSLQLPVCVVLLLTELEEIIIIIIYSWLETGSRITNRHTVCGESIKKHPALFTLVAAAKKSQYLIFSQYFGQVEGGRTEKHKQWNIPRTQIRLTYKDWEVGEKKSPTR